MMELEPECRSLRRTQRSVEEPWRGQECPRSLDSAPLGAGSRHSGAESIGARVYGDVNLYHFSIDMKAALG